MVVNVHGGDLATPSGGQPDLRTADGTALWDLFNVNFQPQGQVNREGLGSPGSWAADIAGVLTQTSPVNIGAASSYRSTTGLLTIDVELFHTASVTSGETRIHVMLTEDHIVGYQQDYVNGPQSTYDHRHALRKVITPIEGDPVVPASPGLLFQGTYTFPVPTSWDLGELDVVVHAGEASGVVHQVRSIAADGGTTMGTDEPHGADPGAAYPVPADEAVFIPIPRGAIQGPVRLRSSEGRLVKELHLPPGATVVRVPVADLAPGVYICGFLDSPSRRVVVRH